jgi:hypothetical protein
MLRPSRQRPSRRTNPCNEIRAVSFDHLVSEREQRWRHVNPERLGGLEVDH